MLTRRTIMITGLALWATPAGATLDTLATAREEILKGRATRSERMRLEAPELAENGNSVTITVEVESPMTEADHVRAIHVLSEKNPLPNVVSIFLSPRAGQAKVATTIRLADSQRITALAELSDGTVLETGASVVVTIAACLDAG